MFGVLTARLERLLAEGDVVAILAGVPAVGIALLTLRPNVWFDGPVALLDELYVAPTLRGQGRGTALLHEAEQFSASDHDTTRRQHGRRRRPYISDQVHALTAPPGSAM